MNQIFYDYFYFTHYFLALFGVQEIETDNSVYMYFLNYDFGT